MSPLLLAKLKSELKRKGVSQKDIAERLCRSKTTISNWFNKGTLTLKQLDEICLAYGVEIKDITFK